MQKGTSVKQPCFYALQKWDRVAMMAQIKSYRDQRTRYTKQLNGTIDRSTAYQEIEV